MTPSNVDNQFLSGRNVLVSFKNDCRKKAIVLKYAKYEHSRLSRLVFSAVRFVVKSEYFSLTSIKSISIAIKTDGRPVAMRVDCAVFYE